MTTEATEPEDGVELWCTRSANLLTYWPDAATARADLLTWEWEPADFADTALFVWTADAKPTGYGDSAVYDWIHAEDGNG